MSLVTIEGGEVVDLQAVSVPSVGGLARVAPMIISGINLSPAEKIVSLREHLRMTEKLATQPDYAGRVKVSETYGQLMKLTQAAIGMLERKESVPEDTAMFLISPKMQQYYHPAEVQRPSFWSKFTSRP